MVVVVSLFIFLLDLAFDYMNKFEVEQVRKLQNSISANETVDNTTDEANTTEDTNTTSDDSTTENNTSVEENTNSENTENSVSE